MALCEILLKTSIVVVALVFSSYLSSSQATADEPKSEKEKEPTKFAEQLIGTWVLTESQRPGTPSGIGTRLKFYTGTHWLIVQPDPKSGVIVFQHGGKYTIDGDILSSTTDFAGASTRSQISKTGSLKIQIDGDTHKQVDPEGVYNETWKRVKAEEIQASKK